MFAARCCAQLCKQALAFMVRLVQVILHTCVLAGAASGDVVVGAAHSLTSAEAFILMPSHCSCASELFLIVCVRVCVCVCVCRSTFKCLFYMFVPVQTCLCVCMSVSLCMSV